MYFEIDGIKTFASTGGNPLSPNQKTIIFIHGAAMDHTVWIQQSRYFSHHGFSVISLDLPGHGRSEGTPFNEIQKLSEWINKVINKLNLYKPIIIGHSLGALIALDLAAELKDKISGLVLLGVSSPMPVHDKLMASALENDDSAFDMINTWGHSVNSKLGKNQIPGLWLMGASIRLMKNSSAGILYSDLTAVKNYCNATSMASKIVCPVLVLIGKEDKMTSPKSSLKLCKEIRLSQSKIIEGSGHMLMTEKPDTIRKEISLFLSNI
jgi:pimeloyl-ACP methyl ester carboxylesterase